MTGRVFLDTSVLVYSVDNADPRKKKQALDVLMDDETGRRFVISTQVMQEFYVIATRKLEKPLSESQAEKALGRLSSLPVVQVDPQMVLAAVSLSRKSKLSFWDALIVEAALESGCQTLLTEDLQDGARFGSLEVVNPFR